MQHLDEGTIHAWLDGALDADESARAEQHVAECAACSAAVAEARGLIAASARIVSSLDIVRGGVIPKSSLPLRRTMWTRLHLTPGRAALAASLLVAVASILTVRGGDKVAVQQKRVASSRDSIAAAPAAGRPEPDVAARTAVPAPAIASQSKPDAQPRSSAPKREATSEIAKQLAGARTVPSDSAPAPRTAVADAKVVAAAPPPPNRADDKAARVAAPAVAPLMAASRPVVDSLASARAPAGANAPVAMREVTATAASANAVGGGRAGRGAGAAGAIADAASRSGTTCYRVPSDSLSRLMKDVFFPSRFALDAARDARGQQVVRSVTADGRVDSVLTNFRWERGELNTINIRWGRSSPLANPAQSAFAQSRGELSMTIRTIDSLVVGEMPGTGQDGIVRLTRIDCRP